MHLKQKPFYRIPCDGIGFKNTFYFLAPPTSSPEPSMSKKNKQLNNTSPYGQEWFEQIPVAIKYTISPYGLTF